MGARDGGIYGRRVCLWPERAWLLNRGPTAARGWGGVIRTSLLVVMKRKKPWPSLDSEAFEVAAKDPKQLPECQALDTGDGSWYSPSTR